MITLQRKLLLLSVCVLSIFMICTSAFAGGGKTGKGGEPGSGCALPDGCSDWKFIGNLYEGILELECGLNDDGSCKVDDCSEPLIGECVSVYLFGSVTQAGNIECLGYIPYELRYNWAAQMEVDAFRNFKPADIRGCIPNNNYFDPACVISTEEETYLNVFDAAKVYYNTEKTRATVTVKVKQIIPTKCTY